MVYSFTSEDFRQAFGFAVEYFLSLSQLKLIDFLTPIYGSARSQIRGAISKNKLSTTKTEVGEMDLNQEEFIRRQGLENKRETYDESNFDDISDSSFKSS